MNRFRACFELFQDCETLVISNAQIEIKNMLPKVYEKTEQTKNIIQFLNSLS
jgi:hypothetical protein